MALEILSALRADQALKVLTALGVYPCLFKGRSPN